jgi:uncharacterized protein YgbK (DUF1537 family)
VRAGSLAAVADDLTGAAELAAVGWRRGLEAEVHTEAGLEALAPLVVLDTDSRTRPRAEAVARSRAAGAWLAGGRPDLVYKKVDSVLRGWTRVETEELLECLGWDRAVVVPANPGLGRVIQDGRYLVRGRPVHETDFARDPLHPIRSSDVGEMLGRDGRRRVTVGRASQASLAEGLTLGEASSRADLVSWASHVARGILAVGAAEFFDALLEARGFEGRSPGEGLATATTGARLVVSGTTSDSGRRALSHARARGIPVLPMPDTLFRGHEATEEALGAWADEAAQALEGAPVVVVTIDREVSGDPAEAPRLEGLLADVVREILERRDVEEIFAEGGATAAAIIRRLGWTRLTVVRELAPGVATMAVEGPRGRRITLKPGSYVWPETIWGPL